MNTLANEFAGRVLKEKDTFLKKLRPRERKPLYLIGNLILWISAHPTGEEKQMLVCKQSNQGSEYSRQTLCAANGSQKSSSKSL